MKKYLFFAASALALASCSSDDFLGENPGNVQNATTAINFGGDAGKISRATSNTGDVINMLDGQFKIYGVKAKGTDGSYTDVFKDYSVWNASEGSTTSNTKGWEYVANNGATDLGKANITLHKDQTIKYWDYASKDYHFVAGSPIEAFTYKTKEGTGDIESATISKLGGHITAKKKTSTDYAEDPSPVYVAEPVIVNSNKYKEAVKFTFVRQQTKVRVGIYETIPGYSITSIKFYPYEENSNAFSSTPTNNIVLTTTTAKYFKGGENISGTINYDWTKPEYTFEYENTGLKESKNWYGGEYENGVKAKVSNHTNIDELYGTDENMHSNGYFTVLPTPSATNPSPILIKCDYTLTSDDGSNETIEVKGATAAIPAAYSKWNTNTLYTYLFKISDNTNGYTGTEDPDHVGLYPITFDAAVKAEQFGTQGTITTVTTPSITTYQDGSVVENSGIKYVTNKEIKVTVTDNTNGDIKTLSNDKTAVGYVAVYKLSDKRTEADLQIDNVATSELIPTSSKDVTLAADNKSFTFTPTEVGHYAIQYLTTAATAEGTPVAYTYKVVEVQ